MMHRLFSISEKLRAIGLASLADRLMKIRIARDIPAQFSNSATWTAAIVLNNHDDIYKLGRQFEKDGFRGKELAEKLKELMTSRSLVADSPQIKWEEIAEDFIES